MKSNRIKINIIHSRRTYTVRELAKLLTITTRTVYKWLHEGMVCLNQDDHQRLILGADAKEFLVQRSSNRKCKLSESDFYCVKCRKKVTSIPDEIKILKTGIKMGKDLESVRIIGKCPICKCLLNRFSTDEKIKSFYSHLPRVIEY
jgi:hypothetical protein